MRKTALLCLIPILAGAPALAQDDDVWRVYPVEGGGGSLAALAASEVDSPEPYWRFVMTCIPGESWDAIVSGVDPAALGAAIGKGGEVTVAVIADGNPDRPPLSGYFPTIGFGPGDDRLAHTANEQVRVADVLLAVEGYAQIALETLGRR